MIGSSIVSSTEDGLDKLAKHARVVLVVVAVVQLVGSTILYVAGGIPDLSMLAVQLVIGASFVGLTVWARKNPLTAVLVGLGIISPAGCGRSRRVCLASRTHPTDASRSSSTSSA
jgi:hypothetical protein